MQTRGRPVPVLVDRSRDAVLLAATRVLVDAPHTSLGELAVALGIGRTTLHRLFPTRQDLLVAIAHDAVDHLARVYAGVGLGGQPVADADALRALRDLVAGLIPLGPSLAFLLRLSELDGEQEIEQRVDALDRPVRAAITAAQRHGDLDPAVPDWWAAETLFAGIYVAWGQIQLGRLAPLDATDLVTRTWLRGIISTHSTDTGQPHGPTAVRSTARP